MRIGILSGGSGWHVQDLLRAATELGQSPVLLDFRAINTNTPDCEALIIRTMPSGSLEQVVFRMDLLQAADLRGVKVVNHPKAVETCVDKFLTDVRLNQAGLLTPRTVVCQRSDDALEAFERLGRDVVVKPLFGSEGRGMMRISDVELAWRSFRAIEQTGGVLYLQEFISHPGWDYRAFVLNGQVIGAMKRTANADWRTNVAQGGHAERVQLNDELQSLAIRAATAVGCDVAGVDLLPSKSGEWYVLEVNAVPGWRALSEVCQLDVAKELCRFVIR
jgi:RimK family alpha-L-glutamate ligase